MGDSFRRIGVVGCGIMGSGIAEVCARVGLDVVVVEAQEAALAAGVTRISSSLDRAVRADKISDEARVATQARLTFTGDLARLADADLVVEAIVESEPEKVALFTALDGVVGDGTILATNTSSIPVMKLAMATSRPEAVVGLHFFNPVPVMGLVELVPSLVTSEATVDAVEQFASAVLHKKVIRSQDRAGFVVNALLVPYLLSAIRMLESGFATAEDVDTGMEVGCRHPMGPLALADLIGLDTTMAIAESLYEEFKEPLFAPPPVLCRMVEARLLGRKTKRGFYRYD